MSATIDTWTGRLGFLAGICAIAAWLAIAGRPGTAAEPAASIRLGVLVNGELALTPLAKPVLRSDELRPGDRGERGTLRVRNQTPRTLSFAVRTTSASRELDRTVRIEIVDAGRAIVRTSLAASHVWSGKKLTLASGESRTLGVRVWIPEHAPDGWQAARGDATLIFSSTAVER